MSSWVTLATEAALSNFHTPNGRHPGHNNPPHVPSATRKHNTRPPTWRGILGIPTKPKRGKGNASKKAPVNKAPNNKAAFSVENPLAGRSRASSTVSDPAAVRSRASSTATNPIEAYTGINNDNGNKKRSGIPFSKLNSNARAALKNSFAQTFGRRFPNGDKAPNSPSKRIAAAQRAAATRKAAANNNRATRNNSKNKARTLETFSKLLTKRGATNRQPTPAEILAAYKSKPKK